MMKLLRLSLSIILTLGLSVSALAQGPDLQFSQYMASPLTLNPAMTGWMNGTYRIGGIYRTQWGSVQSKYESFSLAADANFWKRKMDGSYMGAGLMFSQDKAGDLDLATTNISGSVAYSMQFGFYTLHSFAVGFQGSMVQKGLDLSNAIYPDGPGAAEALNTSASYIDLGAGLLYHLQLQKRLNMYVGGAYFHILEPNISLNGDGQEKIYSKITGTIGGLVEVGNNINLLPSALAVYQGPNSQIMFGTYAQFILGEDYVSETSVSFGTWARIAQPAADAVILAARLDINAITAQLSYDINISELSEASSGRGALEASLIYMGQVVKKPKYGIIFCPRF